MAVSSAKRLTLDLTWSGRSFIYARKSMGPRTEPCGTPEDTAILSDLTPFKTTDRERESKKSLTQLSVLPRIPFSVLGTLNVKHDYRVNRCCENFKMAAFSDSDEEETFIKLGTPLPEIADGNQTIRGGGEIHAYSLALAIFTIF